jgi:membrane-associated phospholipid phosphatase
MLLSRSVINSRIATALMLWICACATLWAGAQMVCRGAACTASNLDNQILATLHAWRQPWLDTLLANATWLGSILVLLPLAIALAWHYRKNSPRKAVWLLPIGVAGAWLLATATKLLVSRPRPELYPSLVAMPADWSFPSAHAMQVTAFAMGWLLMPGVRLGWVIIGAATSLVIMVGVSRLYLQVHFPSDVLAGVIASAAWMAGLRTTLGART